MGDVLQCEKAEPQMCHLFFVGAKANEKTNGLFFSQCSNITM
jgi:hypothetical protein